MPSVSRTVAGIRAGVFADLQRHIDDAQRRGVDLVPLQIGDTCLTPPLEALFARVASECALHEPAHARSAPGPHAHEPDLALYRYGATAGTLELRRAVSERARTRYGIDADPVTEVLVGVGATHAIACVARAVLDPGDEVLLASPYWPLAHGILRSVGADVIEVALTQRLYRDPRLDVEALFSAVVTPKTRALYVITPNNPDGFVLSRAHLEAIARVAKAHDLWVFSDEVYADAVYDGAHVSLATLDAMASRTLTFGSLSKSHALAGARVGHAIAPRDVVTAARKVSTHSAFNVPVVAQRSAVAAITHGESWSEASRDHGLRARDAAVRALEGSGIDFHVAHGGSYLFVDFARALAGRPMRELLERAIEHGVLLAPGEAFGAGYETCARVCYTGVEIARVVEGIERVKRAVEDRVVARDRE